jgi:hypothetical protein
MNNQADVSKVKSFIPKQAESDDWAERIYNRAVATADPAPPCFTDLASRVEGKKIFVVLEKLYADQAPVYKLAASVLNWMDVVGGGSAIYVSRRVLEQCIALDPNIAVKFELTDHMRRGVFKVLANTKLVKMEIYGRRGLRVSRNMDEWK